MKLDKIIDKLYDKLAKRSKHNVVRVTLVMTHVGCIMESQEGPTNLLKHNLRGIYVAPRDKPGIVKPK